MRCPRAHAPTPLVVVARRTAERELLAGFAGCPLCRLEARIEEGDVHFPDAPVSASGNPVGTDGTDAEGARLERLVALLGLAEPGGAVLLTGHYAALAPGLAAALDVVVVTLDAAPPVRAPGVATVWYGQDAVPFSDATFRAAALDAALPLPRVLDAIRTVAVGGRVLGALPLERPAVVRELARDATEWVGEREPGPTTVVPLRRAP